MELVIFKPGYGRWRFQGAKDWPKDLYEQEARVKEAWEQFETEGVVIELPPLKTREERRKFHGTLTWSATVPSERTKRLEEAINVDRRNLGLGN